MSISTTDKDNKEEVVYLIMGYTGRGMRIREKLSFYNYKQERQILVRTLLCCGREDEVQTSIYTFGNGACRQIWSKCGHAISLFFFGIPFIVLSGY